MSEARFQRTVKNYLRKKYPDAFIWKISDRWYSGIPDIYMLEDGRSYYFELKIKGNVATPLQLYTLEKLRKAGAFAGVAYDIMDINNIIAGKTALTIGRKG